MIKLKNVAQEYLRSFPLIKNEDAPEESKSDKDKREYEKIKRVKSGKLSINDIGRLEEREKADILFNKILNKSTQLSKTLNKRDEPVLDDYTWQDLNLIAGNTTTPDKNVLSYIKRNKTAVGGCVMATQIVNPTTEINEIKDKQATTKYLIKNPKVAEGITANLSAIGEHESVGLSLWKKDNELAHKEYKKEINSFYYTWFGLNRKKTSTWGLQCGKWWKDLWLQNMVGFFTVMFLAYMVIWGIKDPYQTWYIHALERDKRLKLYEGIQPSFWKCIQFFYRTDMIFPFIKWFTGVKSVFSQKFIEIFEENLTKTPKKPYLEYPSYYKNFLEFLERDPAPTFYAKLTALFATCMFSFLGLYHWYLAFRKYRKNKSTLNFLAAHLVPIQDLVKSAKKISDIVAKNPVLEKHYGQHLKATRALLAGDGCSAEVKQLIANLQKVTLHNRSYFFSNTGRLLATYTLFRKNKKALANLYYEVGLMDAQLSVYELMVESRKYDDSRYFVFGNLEEAKDNKPVLEMKGMWHFGLDAKRAVANDITMDSSKGPRTIITTGPNAGGKSTYILGTGVNVVLNQVYGICAAAYALQYIFHKIITYVNPTQNLAAGLSLAEAGMAVLEKHRDVFLRVNKPILAIIDEILNGTDPKVAADYSYKILKSRNEKHTNCITLLTTHYMNLPSLAEETEFVKNKKVVVRIPGSAGRRFDYTYKIEDGISDQNIVGDMLVEKGLI